ncbi:MAG: hypothetical protein L0L78_08050 [Tetragenococcus koreensis]|nr:hypothetical protein [Tetragenococcus koreensis]MDN6735557.1 hypothetical protein [Tetragenococcus koreensis]
MYIKLGVISMSVKLRKVGSSHVLTVPNKFEVTENTEFDVFQGRDGSIIYTPKRNNPFEGNWYNHDLQQESVFEDVEDLNIELEEE